MSSGSRPDRPSLSDHQVFARTLWGEARGEDCFGRHMVANVIMNRVNADLGHDNKPDWWGEGVGDVCLKKYQFSCWLPGDPNRAKLLAVTAADPVFQECLEIAEAAMAWRLKDLTNGATHYANVVLLTRLGTLPAWAVAQNWRASHGHHDFFLVP